MIDLTLEPRAELTGFVSVALADLKEGDEVFIDYLDFMAHGQPPVRKVKGPHRVHSVEQKTLTNGFSVFSWPVTNGATLLHGTGILRKV
jgi:hypothetical protein